LFAISKETIDATRLSRSLINDSAGALSTFEGWVRNRNDGQNVKGLEYECFAALAEKEGTRIVAEAKEKFSVVDVACQHRVGNLKVGELAVWVGATAVHRADAFSACRYVIDQVKLRVPVWKKEHYVDGSSTWVNCAAHEHERAKEHEKDGAVSESAYYSRQTLLQEIGDRGQQKLKDSSVLIVGAGGTGCPALQYLVGAGVGRISICDFDTVDASNLHRQPLFGTSDLGKKKAEIAAERLRANNPFVIIQSISQKLDSSNVSRMVNGHDVVLDCTDNLDAKFCIADACREQSKVLIQSSIHGFSGEILLWSPSPSQTDSQSHYLGQCYRCLWPSKDALQDGGRDCISSCTQSGVLGAVPGIVGTLQASETIKTLLGLSSPLTHHVLLIDLLSLSISRIKTRRNPDCPVCSGEGTTDSTKHQEKTSKEEIAATAENAEKVEKAKNKEKVENAEKENAEKKENEKDEEVEGDIDHGFELHWSVLRSRSPRELVYVDIRTKAEIEADQSTRSKLQGRQLNEWPLESIDVNELKLDKNLTYLFMCQRGKRSAILVRKLRQVGHRNVFSLSEGVASMSPQHSEHAKV
jgi:sulfur-carrier protein adenylyltransferase/sulfurtransferase